MEDVLGLEHLNLNTATTRPYDRCFDLNRKDWNFEARPSAFWRTQNCLLSADARRMALAEPP